MTTLSASEARANLYRLMDQAAESHKPIVISGKRSNSVLIARGGLGCHSRDAVLAFGTRHA